MTRVTETSLIAVMNAIAGAPLDDSGGNIVDQRFSDLGFDSLARQELVGRLERTHGVTLDSDIEFTDDSTPREIITTLGNGEVVQVAGDNAPSWRIMLTLDVIPELAVEFEQVWPQVGKSVSAEPANTGQWLLRDASEPDRYYVVSDWTTREEFERFERSERHIQHRQLLHPYRRSGSMTSMDVLTYLPGSDEH